MHREKLIRIKDRGKKLLGFNERLPTEFTNVEVWTLLPMRRIKITFDSSEYVNVKEYVLNPELWFRYNNTLLGITR